MLPRNTTTPTIATATAVNTIASRSHKGRRALRDTHRRGTLARAHGGSNNRYLNRPAIGEQYDRLVAGRDEMASEFLQQLGLDIEQVRQSPGIHRDAVHQFLIEPQLPHRERGDAEICKPEIGYDDARHVSLSVNDIVEHLRHLRPSPLR